MLEHAKHKDHQEELEAAISRCHLEDVIRSVGELDSAEDVSHKLIHIHVKPPNFFTRQLKFASAYVSQLVAARFAQEKKDELIRFITAADGLSETGGLRGNLFEGHAHNILKAGGTFVRRRLDNGVEDTVDLPARTLQVLLSDADVTTLGNHYGRPSKKNYESVDSLVLPNMFFQMTVSSSHGIKLHGYNKLKAALPPTDQRVQFYFVVPDTTFPHFKGAQNFMTAAKKGETEKVTYNAPTGGFPVQYCICIKLA